MRLTASFNYLSAAIQRHGSSACQQVKMLVVAEKTSPASILRRAFGDWQFEGNFTLLALILPGIIFKYIKAGTEWCPGRSFHDISTSAFLTVYLCPPGRVPGNFHVEDIPALFTQ
jgi:hypothetical protein